MPGVKWKNEYFNEYLYCKGLFLSYRSNQQMTRSRMVYLTWTLDAFKRPKGWYKYGG